MDPEESGDDEPTGSRGEEGNAGSQIGPRQKLCINEQIYGDKVGADKIGRDKIVAQQYIAQMVVGGEETITWTAIDYSRHLKRTASLFFDHIRRFAGTADSQQAMQRYLPLHGLQAGDFKVQVNSGERDREERLKSKWSGLADHLQGAGVTGLQIDTLFEAEHSIPQINRLELNMRVDRLENARLSGVEIGALRQGAGGIVIDLAISVEQFRNSRLVGVQVGDVVPAIEARAVE